MSAVLHEETSRANCATAWVVVGSISARDGASPVSATAPVFVAVEEDVSGGCEFNTVVMSRACIDRYLGDDRAPLFYVAQSPGRWRGYGQVLLTPSEVLFIALDGASMVGDPCCAETRLDWWSELWAQHHRHAARLNNHQRCFTVHRPEEEIEHKFTLAAPVDIWALSTRLLTTVAGSGFAGWIGEYRNEFEQWDFLNHLYEITTPDAERGYISFIPAVDGTWIIKRKWFPHDQEIRREHRDRDVLLGPDVNLAEEIAARFGLTPAWGASFRRVRYDINIESLRTGHGYSVMFDRVTTDSDAVLYQCEVEYLRSRTVCPVDDDALIAEFYQLCGLVRDWLAGEGLAFSEDHLSKLTFLREVTAGTAVPC